MSREGETRYIMYVLKKTELIETEKDCCHLDEWSIVVKEKERALINKRKMVFHL